MLEVCAHSARSSHESDVKFSSLAYSCLSGTVSFSGPVVCSCGTMKLASPGNVLSPYSHSGYQNVPHPYSTTSAVPTASIGLNLSLQLTQSQNCSSFLPHFFVISLQYQNTSLGSYTLKGGAWNLLILPPVTEQGRGVEEECTRRVRSCPL